MRTGGRIPGLVAAVVGCAASLLFFPYETASAAQHTLRPEVSSGTRSAQDEKRLTVKSTFSATDNYAMCGKCHSACENGRSHAGRSAIGEQAGAELPLDADGRTTCVTCHKSSRHEARGVSGGHLRVSNLRRELCLTCHRQETETGPSIEIVSPLERAVVQEEHLALIGRAFRLTGTDLTVRLNGAEFHLQLKNGEFSTWLKLQDGVNHIEVAQQEHLLWKGEVFHGESPLGGYERTSSGHRTGNRAQCLECHLKRDEMSSGNAGEPPVLCYGCHDRIGEKRYIHGPLAVGDCLACHDPHGGFGSAHLRQEQTQLCGKCHNTRETLTARACNSSGKACVICHDPHQSDTRYLLKGPQYTMRDISLENR